MKPHTLNLRVHDRYLQTEAKIFDQIMQILHVAEISYFMALPFVKKKKKRGIAETRSKFVSAGK